MTQASAVKPKPGQKSTLCAYNSGPKEGQTENLSDKEPVLIGKTCVDGQGNSGFSVMDEVEEEALEREEAEKRIKEARENQLTGKH